MRVRLKPLKQPNFRVTAYHMAKEAGIDTKTLAQIVFLSPARHLDDIKNVLWSLSQPIMKSYKKCQSQNQP